MVEVLRAPDLLALSTSSADPDDWLAHDYDVDAPVYLLVYPAAGHGQTGGHHLPARWAIAWPVGQHGVLTERNMTGWRHVQLEGLADPLGAEVEMHYGYFGALTKTAGPELVTARRVKLGVTNLAHRREIERLARMVPVREEDEGWSCQDWVKDLLERMVAAEIVSAAACHEAISQAHA
ncbi:hypothetical protein L226DRAFT_392867 [Lentinus tigrinus ALCF2SS1-7]|uniref:uncharacterized protein n=1 Tax=Lentinus tigrinus ALCF2SS1-7 TaxID=1328758 RepID=UPI001165DD6A|nr:hypothetical protein L226DRAFT_392867 [Lentinus tigrinus ALCF2SS1-7]